MPGRCDEEFNTKRKTFCLVENHFLIKLICMLIPANIGSLHFVEFEVEPQKCIVLSNHVSTLTFRLYVRFRREQPRGRP